LSIDVKKTVQNRNWLLLVVLKIMPKNCCRALYDIVTEVMQIRSMRVMAESLLVANQLMLK